MHHYILLFFIYLLYECSRFNWIALQFKSCLHTHTHTHTHIHTHTHTHTQTVSKYVLVDFCTHTQ